jgi:hypothetical protein
LPAELPAAAPPFFMRSKRPMSAAAAAGCGADLLLLLAEGRAAVVTPAAGLVATGDLVCVGDDALAHPRFAEKFMHCSWMAVDGCCCCCPWCLDRGSSGVCAVEMSRKE